MKRSLHANWINAGRRGPKFVTPEPWIGTHGIPEPLAPQDSDALAAISAVVRFVKGEVICKSEEDYRYLFYLSSGMIKKYFLSEQFILDFILPGDFFPLPVCGAYFGTAVAIIPSTVYQIPVLAFRRLLRSNAELEYKIISHLIYVMHIVERHAYILSKNSAMQRLSLFLLLLHDRQSISNNHPGEVYLPMTRADVAAYLGLSAEAVMRSFRALQSRGAVTFKDRQHIALELDEVDTLASGKV